MPPNGSVTYTPLPDSTQEREAGALASIYRLALASAEKKAAGVSMTGSDDAKERSSRNDFSATEDSTA